MIQGFLLGLASGTVCLTACVPVLAPYLLSEDRTAWHNAGLLARFLLGRLAGYLLFAWLAWSVGLLLTEALRWMELLMGFSYILISALLLVQSFHTTQGNCLGGKVEDFLSGNVVRLEWFFPCLLGLFTGLNFCPPLLMAFAASAASGSFMGSLWFFLMFFLGTSLFFIPAPFLSFLTQFCILCTAGRYAMRIVGLYYFFIGVQIVIKGGFR